MNNKAGVIFHTQNPAKVDMKIMCLHNFDTMRSEYFDKSFIDA